MIDKDMNEITTGPVDMETSTPPTGQNNTNPCYTHVFCYKNDKSSKPVVEKVPLPDIQPKCPKEWDAAAWSRRSVGGNSRYHLFVPGDPGDVHEDMFILQISNKTRDGKWVYENIGPMSPKKLKAEMWKFVAQTRDSLKKILDDISTEAIAANRQNQDVPMDETRDQIALLAVLDAVTPPKLDDS